MSEIGNPQGIRAAEDGFAIGGTSIFTYAGDPSAHVSARRIGDLCIDYTNGKLYIAGATGTGHWDLVTSA